MVIDMSWLSNEAKTIHGIFVNLYFSFSLTLILLGVVIQYFKLPLGGTLEPMQLVGRFVIATILLVAYPEIANALSDFTDNLTKELGDFNQFSLVLTRAGEWWHTKTTHWISIKETLTMAVSFIAFFLLYISVFIASAGVAFVWSILYVLSPMIIAFFILPQTAGATKAMFRSLIEVCFWKILWSVLATLLWSFALSKINQPEADVNFLTVICLNLILAISVLVTPMVVHSVTGAGLSTFTSGLVGLGAAAAAANPGALAAKGIMKSTGLARRSAWKGSKAVASAAVSQFQDKKASKSTASKYSNLTPPRWMKEVPPPTEPPGWMQARLDRERAKSKKTGGNS